MLKNSAGRAVFGQKRSQMKDRGSIGVLEGWEEVRVRNPASDSELSDWRNAVGQHPSLQRTDSFSVWPLLWPTMGSSHWFPVLGVKTAAYLLAVSFEDGIVNFGRGGTVQGVSDAPYRLLPAASFGGGQSGW